MAGITFNQDGLSSCIRGELTNVLVTDLNSVWKLEKAVKV